MSKSNNKNHLQHIKNVRSDPLQQHQFSISFISIFHVGMVVNNNGTTNIPREFLQTT